MSTASTQYSLFGLYHFQVGFDIVDINADSMFHEDLQNLPL
jgi:hypothetical protein